MMFGYGSHPLINDYIRHQKCCRIMEIGVDEGDNAKMMIESAEANFQPKEVEYFGFDLFGGSLYDCVKRKLLETGAKISLFQGDSRDTLPRNVEKLPKMDLIFIDGGHEYEVVKSDWENSKYVLDCQTAVFFHNYDFLGPHKVVNSISRRDFYVELLSPPGDCEMAFVKPNEPFHIL